MLIHSDNRKKWFLFAVLGQHIGQSQWSTSSGGEFGYMEHLTLRLSILQLLEALFLLFIVRMENSFNNITNSLFVFFNFQFVLSVILQ